MGYGFNFALITLAHTSAMALGFMLQGHPGDAVFLLTVWMLWHNEWNLNEPLCAAAYLTIANFTVVALVYSNGKRILHL